MKDRADAIRDRVIEQWHRFRGGEGSGSSGNSGSSNARTVDQDALRFWLVRGGIAFGGLIIFVILLVGAAPVGWLTGRIEAELADSTGGEVSVGGVERAELFSFSPTLIARDIRIAQPEWAGDGDLLQLDEARIRVSVWRVLTGRFTPNRIELSGLRAHLIRDEDGRESWQRERGSGDGDGPDLSDLIIRDAIVRYEDARRDRSATVMMIVDDDGFRLAGPGEVRGASVRVAVAGPRIRDHSGPWPFLARITGDALSMRFEGTMPRPLDINHLRGEVTARGNNLLLLDAIIEAGLPGTQPVRLTADVARDGRDWTITDLSGTIGRSQIAGELTVRKQGDRTRIDGRMTSSGFDFDDLADAEGRAVAAAKLARLGPRVIPDTAIDVGNMARTDGRIEFNLRRLLWPDSTPFRSARGVLTLDDRILTVAPLASQLTSGRVNGSVIVNARDRQQPLLTLDLTLAGSRLSTFAGSADLGGSLRGRVRLQGSGGTVRSAVGNSSGSVAFVATDGQLPARMASFIGLDVGRGVTASSDEAATLRCLVMRLDVEDGSGRLSPLIIDTSRSQARVTGTLNLANERLSWALTGAPKRRSLLRYDRPVPISGTISSPSISPPSDAQSVGGVLSMLGDAITGDQDPLATDANCGSLTRQALR